MSTQAVRYLIVIDTPLRDKRELSRRIRDCQAMIDRVRHIRSIQPEWHLLYAAPHIPSFALFSPEMVQFAQDEWKERIAVIQQIGKQLDIPVSQQHLESGHPDLQAKRIAKAINATHVVGYSQAFQKYAQFKRKVNHLFLSIIKEIKRSFGTASFRDLNHRLHR